MDGRKEAYVREVEGKKVLDFNKGKTSHLSPAIFFGNVECRVVRNGVRQQLKILRDKNLAVRGIIADDLEIGDKVVLDYVDDLTFYRTLRDHGQLTPGVFVWLDPDLETILGSAKPPERPRKNRRQ